MSHVALLRQDITHLKH